MARMICSITPRAGAFLVLVWFSVAVLAGCSSTNQLPNALQDMEEGTNTIILVRNQASLDAEPAAESFLVDARKILREEGYQLAVDDTDNLLIMTEPQQIEPGLAVRIRLKAEEQPDGSRMDATAAWAPTTGADDGEWLPAQWTSGNNRAAFLELIDVVQNIGHNRMGAGTERMGVGME